MPVPFSPRSGSASGVDAYSASGATDSWANTSGNGYSSHTEAHDSWGLSVAESQQSQWQQAYTTVSGPAGSVATGGASATGQASGNAAYFNNASGSSSQTVSTGSMSGMGMGSGSGLAATVGSGWSSAVSGQDHYNDQVSSSQTANANGTWASVTTALNTVWGSGTSQGTNTGMGSLSGLGTATVGGLGGPTPTSYNMAVTALGFSGGAGFRATPGGPAFGAFRPPAAIPAVGGIVAAALPALPKPTTFDKYVFAGWVEANTLGLVAAPPPLTAQDRLGIFTGHLLALVQGQVEADVVGPAAQGGGAMLATETGPVGGGVAVGGAVVQAHGEVVTVSAVVLIVADAANAAAAVIVAMAAAPPPPPAPGGAGNPAPNGGVNPGDLKVLTKARLQQLGVDAEAFKADMVGAKAGARFNIAAGPNGEAYLVPVRPGAGAPVPTGHTIAELPILYPLGGH